MISNKSTRLLETVFALSIIIAGGTIFNINYSSIVTAVLIGSSICLMISTKKVTFYKNVIINVFLIGIFLLLQCVIIDPSSLTSNLKLFIKFIFIVIGTQIMMQNKTNIFELFYKIILVTSALSFVIYILILAGADLPRQQIEGMNYWGVLYLNHISIGNGLAGSGINIARNSGMFWEPGLYQVYLNYALLYCLYKKKGKVWTVFILLSIASTLSPSGYITSIAIIAIYLFGSRESGFKKFIAILISATVLAGVYPWFSNLMSFKTTTDSYGTRIQDISLGVQTFINNPVIGVGTSQGEYISSFINLYGRVHGNTNGLINIAMQFGVVGIVFFLYIYSSFSKIIIKLYDKTFCYMFVVWIVCSLINEPIQTNTFMLTFVSIGMLACYQKWIPDSIQSDNTYEMR